MAKQAKKKRRKKMKRKRKYIKKIDTVEHDKEIYEEWERYDNELYKDF